jgi:HPt (histidine-containing phosphotransfer) domain-containing protein
MTIDPTAATDLMHSAGLGGGPILDAETLCALVELGGEDDPGLLEELVGLFVDDAGRRVAGILAALDRGDVETVARAAHALKSASANLGAFGFSSACRELETQARQGLSIDEPARLVTRMFPEVASALEQLQRR